MAENRTLWCGNLSDKVTEEILYELFLQAAPLENVKIPVSADGRKFNYAFVTFKHEISIDYVIELLSGIRLFGKNLNIQRRNSNSQNNDRTTERSDYKNSNQNQITADALRANFAENRGRFDRSNSYPDREDHYRKNDRNNYDTRNDNRNNYDNRNDSPNRRRHNYSDRRNSFHEWNGRRNRHY